MAMKTSDIEWLTDTRMGGKGCENARYERRVLGAHQGEVAGTEATSDDRKYVSQFIPN